jgi:hypothetical protein
LCPWRRGPANGAAVPRVLARCRQLTAPPGRFRSAMPGLQRALSLDISLPERGTRSQSLDDTHIGCIGDAYGVAQTVKPRKRTSRGRPADNGACRLSRPSTPLRL